MLLWLLLTEFYKYFLGHLVAAGDWFVFGVMWLIVIWLFFVVHSGDLPWVWCFSQCIVVTGDKVFV